jgi:glycosyltransferase involved in cell wall biosynthesis
MISTTPENATDLTGRQPVSGLTVCHVFSGDLWAGAEVAIFNLLSCLNENPRLRVLAVSLNEGELTDRLRGAGIATHVIPEARHGWVGILGRATRALRGTGVTILHSHRYKENVLAWLLAKRLGIRELVTTMHGMQEAPTTSRGQVLRARCRSGLDDFVLRRFFSAVVAVSDEMKRTLVSGHGFREDQVEVIRNGGRFPRRTSTPRASGEPLHIGTVARMVPVKGLELFLDAAALLRRQAPGVRFSILGDGPLREPLLRRAEALGIADCTEFLAPRPDAFAYYESLDVYVNTSLHEGLPLSIVEAMACGRPIVSAAVGGIPEIVTHGEHGFLLEGRDASRFADSFLALVRDESLRVAMGGRAAATAHSQLSAPTMADAYRRLYERCVAGAGARRRRSS